MINIILYNLDIIIVDTNIKTIKHYSYLGHMKAPYQKSTPDFFNYLFSIFKFPFYSLCMFERVLRLLFTKRSSLANGCISLHVCWCVALWRHAHVTMTLSSTFPFTLTTVWSSRLHPQSSDTTCQDSD